MPENKIFERRQLQIMFYVFLGLFTILSIVSLLIITNVITGIDAATKDNARTLLFVSVAGAILQAFAVAYLSSKAPEFEIHISIIFPVAAGTVNLDSGSCMFAVYDADNNSKPRQTLRVFQRGAGWVCVVKLKNAEDSVRLFLKDTTGKDWSTAYVGMRLIAADVN